MKITFEGETLLDIFSDMERALNDAEFLDPSKPAPAPKPVAVTKPQGLSPEAFKALVTKPVDKPVVKPVEKKPRTEKQLANDERMRVAALAKIAARKAAKAAPVEEPVEEQVADAPEAQPFAEPEADTAEIVKLRTQTMEELQAAYANGHHKEVLELLSRFGNGAKSFRELPPESFVPIRQAIDNGALT